MSNAFGEFFGKEGTNGDEAKSVEKPVEKRVIGKIIKIQIAKEGEDSEGGWGFISSKEIPYTRIFFHWTSLKQDTLRFPDLKIGMRVSFTPTEIEGKGFRAIKIKVITDNEPSTDRGTEK